MGGLNIKRALDSVRSYMMNLNTHRANSDLRKKRANIRKQGSKPTGAELVDTLGHYSERGMEYVKTLTGIMSVNGLGVADNARLLSEPVLLIVNAVDEKDAVSVADEISELRATGELGQLINSMGIAR
jgi:Bax protein